MGLNEHHYALTVRWTGNLGGGTESYRGYARDHDIEIPGLPTLKGSADPTFHGDRTRYNPEQLLLAALSQCHMLSFLHVAVRHGVVVTGYEDNAEGVMKLNREGSGQFESVTLKPHVTIADPAHSALMAQLPHEPNKFFLHTRDFNSPFLHEPIPTSAAA